MKNYAVLLFALLMTMAGLPSAPPAGAAGNYYVSTSGSITNNGLTPSTPWRSVVDAVSRVSTGAVINISAGVYTESVINITIPLTLNGTNLYAPSNPPFLRHTSRTIIKPQFTNDPNFPMVIRIATNGVTIQNLTIEGDVDGNGLPDVTYAIYSTNRPLNVNHCLIENINGIGIACLGYTPAPAMSDTDSVRSYFGCNRFSGFSAATPSTATALYLYQAPATCESNDISGVSGTSANAGIYLAECKYTTATTNWITLRNNSFDDCTTAIWANSFGGTGEKLILSGNLINNSLIGIRVTAAEGQALILSNHIAVAGVSTSSSATPARGIWIQADRDPWGLSNTLWQTDHLVFGNVVRGAATEADGTTGILLAYDTTTLPDMHNGTRATLRNNTIDGFDVGLCMSSGVDGVNFPTSTLVRAVAHANNILNNISYALYTTGITETVNATGNFWGFYSGPVSGLTANAISPNIDTASWIPIQLYLGSNSVLTKFASIDPVSTNADWFQLGWINPVGWHYRVYRSTNLLSGTFLPLTTNIFTTVPMNTYTDKTATGTGPYYYRITVTN